MSDKSTFVSLGDKTAENLKMRGFISMYVLVYAGIMFGLAYFDILNRVQNIFLNVLIFGSLYLGFTIVRSIILSVTMPPRPKCFPPERLSARRASMGERVGVGTIMGVLADTFLPTFGVGTLAGQMWDQTAADEAAYQAESEEFWRNYRRQEDDYECQVASRRDIAIYGMVAAFFITIGCAYYAGL